MIEFTMRLFSVVDANGRGQFQATSFTEHIGRRVEVTGLDPALHHVLAGVENREDGTVSTLTIHTHNDAEQAPELSANLSTRWDTPTVEVRAHVDGDEVTVGRLDAPLQPGQTVRVGEQLYNVADVSHPARRDDGTTDGPDYQHADLTPIDGPPPVRDLGPSPFGALLAGG